MKKFNLTKIFTILSAIVLMIIVYELFVTFRQLEIIVKKKWGDFLNGRTSK